MSSADLITEILTADRVALPNEFTGMYWSAVAGLYACSDEDEEVMSSEGSSEVFFKIKVIILLDASIL